MYLPFAIFFFLAIALAAGPLPPNNKATVGKNNNGPIETYKAQLRQPIRDEKFCTDMKAWATFPVAAITTEVLQDIFENIPKMQEGLLSGFKPGTGSIVKARPQAKAYQRVLEKAGEKELAKWGGDANVGKWKINSDLSAFRVIVKDPHGVDDAVKAVVASIRRVKSTVLCERGADKRFPLIQFLYAYMPDPGYVSEIQVIHEFEAWAWARNSHNLHPGNGPKLLPDPYSKNWGNKDTQFHDAVEALILNPSNDKTHFNVKQALKELTGKDTIEPELAGILNPYLVIAGLDEV